MIVSQAYGNWIPFAGAGINRSMGSVKGRLELTWKAYGMAPSIGEAENSPEPSNARLIFGVQRQCSLFNYFLNGEIKASGALSGKTFVVSTGLAAPFRIGSNSSLVRFGRNRPDHYELAEFPDADEAEFERAPVVRHGRNKPKSEKKSSPVSLREERVERYWTWDESRGTAPKKGKAPSRENGQPEMVFIR